MTDDGWLALEADLVGVRYLTASQVSEASGLDAESCRRVWRAMGFVDANEGEALFSDRDVAVLSDISRLARSGILDLEGVLGLTRATCHAQARVAEAQAQVIVERTALLNRRSKGPAATVDLAETDPIVPAAQRVIRHLEHFVGYTWRRHLFDALSREATRSVQDATTQMTIGFADLVDFTALSERSSALETGALISRFEAAAYDVVVGRGGRVIKMIGDEAFFVADSAQTGVTIAMELVRTCTQDEALPAVSVGMSIGAVLSQRGDVVGRPVNLASRLAKLAEPSTGLVSEDFLDVLTPSEEWQIERLPPRLIKGIGWLPSVCVRTT